MSKRVQKVPQYAKVLPKCCKFPVYFPDSNGNLIKQRGVKAKQDIAKGTIVCWYEGKVRLRPLPLLPRKGVQYYAPLDHDVYDKLYEKYYPNMEVSYVVSVGVGNVTIDVDAISPEFSETLGRTVNHSDKPNVKLVLKATPQAIYEFIANPDMKDPSIAVALVALNDIKNGDELGYDYNVNAEFCPSAPRKKHSS